MAGKYRDRLTSQDKILVESDVYDPIKRPHGTLGKETAEAIEEIKDLVKGASAAHVFATKAEMEADYTANPDNYRVGESIFIEAKDTPDYWVSAVNPVQVSELETGAVKITVDSTLCAKSANPIQNSTVTTALAGKAASSHTHTSSSITDWTDQMAKKADVSHTQGMETINGLEECFTTVYGTLANKANSSHTHTIANVTNLQTTLDGKAASSHSHTIANVTNLQSTLDGKAASSHTHTSACITDWDDQLKLKADVCHTHAISNIPNLDSRLCSTAFLCVSGGNSYIYSNYDNYVLCFHTSSTGLVQMVEKDACGNCINVVELYQNPGTGVALPANSASASSCSVVIGASAHAPSPHSILIGTDAQNCGGEGSIVIGDGARSCAHNSVVIGTYAHAGATNTTYVGNRSMTMAGVDVQENNIALIGTMAPNDTYNTSGNCSGAAVGVRNASMLGVGSLLLVDSSSGCHEIPFDDLCNAGNSGVARWTGNVGFGEETFIGPAENSSCVTDEYGSGYARWDNRNQDIHGVTGFSCEKETTWKHRLMLPWDVSMTNDTSYLMAGVCYTTTRFSTVCGAFTDISVVQPLMPANTSVAASSILPTAIPNFENSPILWSGHFMWDQQGATNMKALALPWDVASDTKIEAITSPTKLAAMDNYNSSTCMVIASSNNNCVTFNTDSPSHLVMIVGVNGTAKKYCLGQVHWVDDPNGFHLRDSSYSSNDGLILTMNCESLDSWTAWNPSCGTANFDMICIGDTGRVDMYVPSACAVAYALSLKANAADVETRLGDIESAIDAINETLEAL